MNRRDFLQNRMYYDRVIRKIRDSLEDRVLTTKDAQRIADGITTENGLTGAIEKELLRDYAQKLSYLNEDVATQRSDEKFFGYVYSFIAGLGIGAGAAYFITYLYAEPSLLTMAEMIAAAVIGPAVGIFLERQYGLMR